MLTEITWSRSIPPDGSSSPEPSDLASRRRSNCSRSRTAPAPWRARMPSTSRSPTCTAASCVRRHSLGRFTSVAASPDGRELLVAGREVAVISLGGRLASAADLSLLATMGRRDTAMTFDALRQIPIRLRPGKPPEVLGSSAGEGLAIIEVSPNGRWAAAVGPRGTLRRWDLQTGRRADIQPRKPSAGGGAQLSNLNAHLAPLEQPAALRSAPTRVVSGLRTSSIR